MRKNLLIVVLIAIVTDFQAQSVRDEIRDNIRLSASNYLAYPAPAQLYLTPSPQGKKPFYISHYGRHGSRHHTRMNIYEEPYANLVKADSLGLLTPLGKDVMRRVGIIRKEAYNQYGELTPLGAQQHRQIVKRMVERFPEIFKTRVTIDARSTMVRRCILSMENAMMQMARMCPEAVIHHNATQRDMWYLNYQDNALRAIRNDSTVVARYKAFADKYEDNDRLVCSIYNDTALAKKYLVNGSILNYTLFKLASNVQSTEIRQHTSLYDIFTDDEVYRNWKKENAWWYVKYGAYTVTGGKQTFIQRYLLRRIISDADSCIKLKRPSVQMRFGHETCLLPLVCLLEINDFGLATDDLESLDHRGWANYRAFPMGGNVQIIFYRSSPEDDDVWLKVLLNENEARLPLDPVDGPYYRWKDFREYFMRKLDAYVEP